MREDNQGVTSRTLEINEFDGKLNRYHFISPLVLERHMYGGLLSICCARVLFGVISIEAHAESRQVEVVLSSTAVLAADMSISPHAYRLRTVGTNF